MLYFVKISRVINLAGCVTRQTLAANDQHKMAALIFWIFWLFFFKQCEEEEMDHFLFLYVKKADFHPMVKVQERFQISRLQSPTK